MNIKPLFHLLILLLPFLTNGIEAHPDSSQHSPQSNKLLEGGISGSLLIIEGITEVSASLTGGYLQKISNQHYLGMESALQYQHVRDENRLNLLMYGSWQNISIDQRLTPFLMVGGGLRRIWVGSFGYTVFPVGLQIGFRYFFFPTSALRMAYSFQRITNDPIANFSEHRIVIGVSIFFTP
ncbi:MAG: hypothetical protein D6748_06520 [Calditrichaeota bacterium]|nr:MAG: hypothetical protein D6748_06520 [Calditrichota bacterium]